MSIYLAKSHATQALSAKDTNEKLNFIARAIYELGLEHLATLTQRLTVSSKRADYGVPFTMLFTSSAVRNISTTSDMPSSGMKVVTVMPPVAFVRFKPSL